MFFPICVILISAVALSSSARAFQALRRMHLLTRNFWKENGLETLLMPVLWLMLLVGGLGLLFRQEWAKILLQITLILLMAFVWISGIITLFKVLNIIRKGGQAKNSISKFNLEILEKTGLSLFDSQRINTFSRRESNFFISQTDPEETDAEDIEKTKLDAHVRKHFRKQFIATIINTLLATSLIWLAWWNLE